MFGISGAGDDFRGESNSRKFERHRNGQLRRCDFDTRFPSQGTAGITAGRREFSADTTPASRRPAGMLRGVPICLEQSTDPRLVRQSNDLIGRSRRFCKRGRIRYPQMHCRDLRMNEVATPERPGDRCQTTKRSIEFNR